MSQPSSTSSPSPDAAAVRSHPGSCHCGAVKFEVIVDAAAAGRCNCSMCNKVGALSSLVKPVAFTLLCGADDLSAYEWGGKTCKRFFCRRCGVHCFTRGHLAEVGGDYVSVNFLALDDVDPATVRVSYWDGRHDNWYAGTRPEPWPIFVRAAG